MTFEIIELSRIPTRPLLLFFLLVEDEVSVPSKILSLSDEIVPPVVDETTLGSKISPLVLTMSEMLK